METEFLDKTGLAHLWEKITGKISGYIPTTQKNVAGGVAGLDSSGNIPSGLFSTIPIDKGGTGATSASTALTNLGAAAVNHTHNDYLPLAGGNMTGYISWGNSPNAGLEWITDNGTRIHLRPYSPANTFQLTLKPSDGNEFGAINVDTSGNISFAQALTVANGGTGATDAATARSNLGVTPKNIGALSTAGGNMTGDVDFGEGTRGCRWTTANGTKWHLRPHYGDNLFQLTLKPTDAPEYGAFAVNGNGVMSLSTPLAIDSGGTGANNAEAARNNLGAAAADHTHAYLPLSGGTMTGYIDFGRDSNGLSWTTDNGTVIHLRPYSLGNVFQITLKTTDGTEFGAVNIDTSGNISLAQDLTIADGGTGASDAETARSNLGAAAANHTHDYLPLAGGTITGELLVSNNNSAAGYVRIFEDNEGGNIAIGSPDGHEFQFDAFNNEILRCYAYGNDNVIRGFSFNRTNGALISDGPMLCSGGNTVYHTGNIIYSSTQPTGSSGAIWLKPV